MSDRTDDDTPSGGGAWWADRPDASATPAWMPAPEPAAAATVLPTETPRPSTPPPPPTAPRRPTPGPAKPKRRRFARFLAWTACVLSVLILVVSIGGYVVIHNLVGQFQKIDIGNTAGAKAAKGSETFLLVGSDSREGLSRAEQARLHTGSGDYGQHSDTMILAHISHRGSGHATLVSLPRDSLVEVPEFTDAKGKVHPAHKSKLNAAFSLGGPRLTVATIEAATGVHIDHYVEVNFTGFLKMVNAVGGVDICVPKALHDKDSGLDLVAGNNHLIGKQALAYVRARHIYANQDLGRIQAQQKFIGSMIRKTLSAGTISNPLRIKRLLDALGSSITTDSRFSSGNLLDLATSLRNFSPSHVTFTTVPVKDPNFRYPGLGATLLWDTTAAQAMFTLINQDKTVDDSRTEKTLKPSQVTVQVLNGAGTAGLGSRTQRELTNSGFLSAGPARTADAVTDRTTIRYSGQDSAAKTLAKAVPNAQFEKVDGLGATVELIIGKDFTSTVHLTPSPTASKGPATRTAADASCS